MTIASGHMHGYSLLTKHPKAHAWPVKKKLCEGPGLAKHSSYHWRQRIRVVLLSL